MKTQNVEKVDSDILVFSNELRKSLDAHFNEILDENSNFNSFYDRRNETFYLNFNIYKKNEIDSIKLTLNINKDDK